VGSSSFALLTNDNINLSILRNPASLREILTAGCLAERLLSGPREYRLTRRLYRLRSSGGIAYRIAGISTRTQVDEIGGHPAIVLDRERIGRLDQQGLTMREIAEEMGVSAASVCRI
jgi:hypothetical protein